MPRLATLALVSSVMAGCASDGNLGEILAEAESVLAGSSAGSLTTNEITQGLKQALAVGSDTVVGQLGRANGFNADPTIRIRLPESLQKARKVAAKVGLDESFNDLETRLNRAAEQATPKAKTLFISAIRSMSVSDAKGILQGPDNAATVYFRDKTGDSLKGQMRPIIDQALSEVGAVRTFNDLLARYNKIPFAPKVDADLTGHVVDQGSDGIFHYLAKEEKAIRENPLKRTSKLLQRVFAGQ
ncbi:MAG: DUF4197 domain-containing protein [Granulosicoccus sp.]|nr:DUF4197 domain-containing protein [Granulosicoccus sp.]